jgi:hypothetical protein
VLFSSLCLQIFIFYFGIYRIKSIFIFLARHQAIKTKHSTGQSTPSGSASLHVHVACVAGGIRGHERTGRLKYFDSLYMAKHTRGTRVRIKTRKIQNKNVYSPYSNETFYIIVLEYKADFTLIEQIVKSLEDIRGFFRKYMIHCFGLCQCF